ncbi:MAG: hypothetical protein C4541_09865 [Candidatus Auribacter fodinae]|jgi:vacuolar-type H+-ATPase subunit H|uniref:V-type ATP synthase subunit H n=1 Tax=Candidatus Auribacter fodinae TaxID=2093366 RepID=A0A3A4QXV9_9BACT|nr:MAG: hypothetical protein C4541_09865 [Candidatus Auribacter fodinae]
MKEIITQLLDAEKQAKDLTANAKQQADAIARDADAKVNDIKNAIIDKAQADAKQLIADTQISVEKEKDVQIKQAEEHLIKSLTAKKDVIPALVKEITKAITSVTLPE